MKIKQLIKSFRYAGRGIAYVFRHEQNFRIQVFISLLVVVFIFLFNLTKTETIILLLLILLVFILELLNSALEKFTDILAPRLHRHIEIVKNILAAMVLCAALGSVIIGIMIFWPYINNLVGFIF